MTPRKKRGKSNPRIAAAEFKPSEDWTHNEALSLFEAAQFPFNVDKTHYEEAVEGVSRLPDESIDVVIADPPFGISFTGKDRIYNRDSNLVVNGYSEINEGYDVFSKRWILALPRLMKRSAVAWIFSGWTNLASILDAVAQTELTMINHIVWKYQFGVFTKRKFVTSHYHLLFLAKDPKRYYFNKIEHYPLDVWKINRTYMRGQLKNSTKLPEKLVMRCMDFTSRPGDLILDPFMGNGTTAVVAKGTYRHFLGFEINPEMRNIIKANLEQVKLGKLYTPYSTRQGDLAKKVKKEKGTSKVVDEDSASRDAQTTIDSWIE